jgi:hypothetical protein
MNAITVNTTLIPRLERNSGNVTSVISHFKIIDYSEIIKQKSTHINFEYVDNRKNAAQMI